MVCRKISVVKNTFRRHSSFRNFYDKWVENNDEERRKYLFYHLKYNRREVKITDNLFICGPILVLFF